MNAIKVAKAVNGSFKSGLHVWHVLNDRDPGKTLCGLVRVGLPVVAEGPIEKLPAVEGCGSCRRSVEGWSKPERAEIERFTLQPSLGSVRRTGPLSHGLKSRRGSRLR